MSSQISLPMHSLYVSLKYRSQGAPPDAVNTFHCGRATWTPPVFEAVRARICLSEDNPQNIYVGKPLAFHMSVELADPDGDISGDFFASLNIILTQWTIVGYFRQKMQLTKETPHVSFTIHLAPIVYGSVLCPTIRLSRPSSPSNYIPLKVYHSHTKIVVKKPPQGDA